MLQQISGFEAVGTVNAATKEQQNRKQSSEGKETVSMNGNAGATIKKALSDTKLMKEHVEMLREYEGEEEAGRFSRALREAESREEFGAAYTEREGVRLLPLEAFLDAVDGWGYYKDPAMFLASGYPEYYNLLWDETEDLISDTEDLFEVLSWTEQELAEKAGISPEWLGTPDEAGTGEPLNPFAKIIAASQAGALKVAPDPYDQRELACFSFIGDGTPYEDTLEFVKNVEYGVAGMTYEGEQKYKRFLRIPRKEVLIRKVPGTVFLRIWNSEKEDSDLVQELKGTEFGRREDEGALLDMVKNVREAKAATVSDLQKRSGMSKDSFARGFLIGVVGAGDFRVFTTAFDPRMQAPLYKSWMAKEAGVLRYYPERFDA